MSAKAKAGRYTYLLPLPTITALDVASGPIAGGTTVTITGTGFTGATEVTFGGVDAAGFTVVNATTITATTAAYPNLLGVNTTVYVFVTTAAGTSDPQMAGAFTFTVPIHVVGAPTVTGVAPERGPGRRRHRRHHHRHRLHRHGRGRLRRYRRHQRRRGQRHADHVRDPRRSRHRRRDGDQRQGRRRRRAGRLVPLRHPVSPTATSGAGRTPGL